MNLSSNAAARYIELLRQKFDGRITAYCSEYGEPGYSTRFEALIRLPQYAVWWASAGCLPDNDEPCFTGSLKECEQYVEDDPDGYMEGLSDHNLYSFSIDTWEDEEED